MVDSANQFVQMNVVCLMYRVGMRLIDPYVVQYAEHAKLENLFHSSPKQLQELQRQRLAVAWRRRKLKACPLLIHAIHYY